jgi:hypothetical protein
MIWRQRNNASPAATIGADRSGFSRALCNQALYSTQRRLTMSEQDVLANQKHILENQKAILANQEAIKGNQHAIKDNQTSILDNQGAIKKNQESLDLILKNQQQILALLKK